MGLEHGKIGDRIAVVLNGQQIYKKLYKPTQTLRFRPFVFAGKERDEETGYGYFGARYMDHELMTSFTVLAQLRHE